MDNINAAMTLLPGKVLECRTQDRKLGGSIPPSPIMTYGIICNQNLTQNVALGTNDYESVPKIIYQFIFEISRPKTTLK